MEQPSAVALRRIEWVTPTLAEALSRCMLSAAFLVDPAYAAMRRPSIPAILGIVSHKLAARVARGEFDDRDDRTGRLSEDWDESIRKAHAALKASVDFGPVPEPARWGGYQLVRGANPSKARGGAFEAAI
jgi:hypothetical protein